jgi:hypothetical protein
VLANCLYISYLCAKGHTVESFHIHAVHTRCQASGYSILRGLDIRYPKQKRIKESSGDPLSFIKILFSIHLDCVIGQSKTRFRQGLMIRFRKLSCENGGCSK